MASTARSEPSATATIAVRLQSITHAAAGVLLFELAAAEGALPRAQAGAHLDIHLPAGRQRQYSLVTPLCSEKSYVIAVKREAAGRGGSLWLHDEARVGTELRVSQPRNNFELDETAPDTLLLAGGIGITPIYAMFARLQELGRRVRLHYWSRSCEHTLFFEQLKDDRDVSLHYSSDADRVSIAEVIRHAGPQTQVYCCGPSRMLDESIISAPHASRLHIEHFGGVARPEDDETSSPFTVHLARKGLDLEIAADQTILGALLAAGVDVPYSCEEGVCGACETTVLAGEPLHRDSVHSPDDHARRGTIMICCSLSRSRRLVLDI
jgi:tetrachlorobenzoquinone reductase